MKISHRRKGQLVVLYQVVTDPYCNLSVIFCGFISHLIGRETIKDPEIFSGVHGFIGKTAKKVILPIKTVYVNFSLLVLYLVIKLSMHFE